MSVKGQKLTSASEPLRQLRADIVKSRKLNDPKNLAEVDFEISPLLHRLLTPLRRSGIDFGLNHAVPHIAERNTHQRL
jgi:hypothetical protein